MKKKQYRCSQHRLYCLSKFIRHAIDIVNRKIILMQIDVAFKRLKKDKLAWEQELQEREEWGFEDGDGE